MSRVSSPWIVVPALMVIVAVHAGCAISIGGGASSPEPRSTQSTIHAYGTGETRDQARRDAWDDAVDKLHRLGWDQYTVNPRRPTYRTVEGGYEAELILRIDKPGD